MEDWSLPTRVRPTLSVHCTSDTYQPQNVRALVGAHYKHITEYWQENDRLQYLSNLTKCH